MNFSRYPDEPTLEEFYQGTTDPLPRAEERALVRRYQETGDEDALDRLVRANMRFVVSTAQKYLGGPLSLTELVSEGTLGLLTAINRFEVDRGLKLISYAVWWIRQTILQALPQNQRIVRTPSNVATDRQSIEKARTRLLQVLERDPVPEEIAEDTGLSLERVRRALDLEKKDLSFDAPLRPSESDSDCRIDFFSVDGPADIRPDQALEQKEAFSLLEQFLGLLEEERDRYILRSYYGLGGHESRTLEKIGEELGISRERVRQLKEKTLARLQHLAVLHKQGKLPLPRKEVAA